MLTGVVLGIAAVCAVWPALLFFLNLWRYRAPAPGMADGGYAISVLIPARDEEANIGEALRCVLGSRGVTLEVLVLDDDSVDRTGEIVSAIAAGDSRVRLVRGRGLPPGWNGKQHACDVLAGEASSPLLAFLDADVRIEPELLARMAAFRERTGAALVSGFPRLITVTWMEQLLLPLIHFVLLGFLPMGGMRKGTKPSFAAGCGQFMLVERAAYRASGGHGAIRETMHDGLLLPRVLRRAGYRTDIADITGLAQVRMYDSAAKVWSGLAKNATEGIATAGKIVPLSAVLFLGQVLPPLLAAFLLFVVGLLTLLRSEAVSGFLLRHFSGQTLLFTFVVARGDLIPGVSEPWRLGLVGTLCFLVILCVYLPRLLAVRRFQQPLRSALLHPVGVLLLLGVQWYALGRKVFGKPVGWRQRTYSSETGTQVG